jgi:hypothetical protein
MVKVDGTEGDGMGMLPRIGMTGGGAAGLAQRSGRRRILVIAIRLVVCCRARGDRAGGGTLNEAIGSESDRATTLRLQDSGGGVLSGRVVGL